MTGRRLGPDGVLILECDLNRDRTSGSKNTVAVVLQSGWMPDVIAAFPPFLRDFVPTDETIADPVELTRQIAAKLLTVPRELADWPWGLYTAVCEWAEIRGIAPAEAA